MKKSDIISNQIKNSYKLFLMLENSLIIGLGEYYNQIENDLNVYLKNKSKYTLSIDQISTILQKNSSLYYITLMSHLTTSRVLSQTNIKILFNIITTNSPPKKPLKLPTTTWKHLDPQVQQLILKQSTTSYNYAYLKDKKYLSQILKHSYDRGLGANQTSELIKKGFNNLKRSQAKRIAITEINSAQNMAVMDAYSEFGVEYHQWWSALDNRVRNTHSELHGKIVKVGTPFSNGLFYPGDRNGAPSEFINCRCTTVPYLIPLGMIAPPGLSEFTEDQLVKTSDFDRFQQILQ